MSTESKAQEEAVFLYTEEPEFQEKFAQNHFVVAGLTFCPEHNVGVVVITTAEKGSTLNLECALESLINLATNISDSEDES